MPHGHTRCWCAGCCGIGSLCRMFYPSWPGQVFFFAFANLLSIIALNLKVRRAGSRALAQ